jgi:hypothetical protein
VSLVSNSISGFARGIGLLGVQCPGAGSECVLNGNRVEGSSGERICIGINLAAITGYTLTRNVARANGSPPPCFPPTGITLNAGSTGNTVTNNDSSHNHGLRDQHGSGHERQYVREQHSMGERGHRPAGLPGTTNLWNRNNRCGTEGGAVPGLICNPGE